MDHMKADQREVTMALESADRMVARWVHW